MTDPLRTDPLRTGELRAAALAAWAQHPGRFREDANGEEDHARGYYRDRVVVELAQNAADAAALTGAPGRLLLRLVERPDGAALVAANTGAPLDAAGVASLASLRASAKRDAASSVGRFGVGFAAVRSVSDRVSVVSSDAVRFDLRETAAALAPLVAADPVLADEVARRGTWLPVLRLPWPGAAPGHAELVPGGWDTVVVLELRDEEAVGRVRAQLDVDDTLLLALPALAEVTVEHGTTAGTSSRRVADVAARWVVARRAGVVDAGLLADRPVEERSRTGWELAWAVRRDGSTPPGVVHAPTPTDEPCTLPAVLVGTFPLDPTRRHVAAGPLTSALVREAGAAWADLLVACRDDAAAPDPAALLTPGLPAGPLDAELRAAAAEATRTAPVLRTVAGGAVAPADALLPATPVPARAAALLGDAFPALVHPTPTALVRALDLRPTDLADLVDVLPVPDGGRARELYAAFADADAGTLEHLATLPVPLADGRTVRGARGLVVLADAVPAEAVDALAEHGLRVVHPDAAHPLLERLGAERLTTAALLRSPAVRSAALEEPDLLLALVAAALDRGEVEPAGWWGDVLLPAEDGDLLPARGLVLGGSRAAALLDPEVLPPVDPAARARWGDDVLAAVGVRADLAVTRVPLEPGRASADATAQEALEESLDGWPEYLAEVLDVDAPVGGAGAVGGSGSGAGALAGPGSGDAAPDVVVVADLDAVRPEAWPEVLVGLTGTAGTAGTAGTDDGGRDALRPLTWPVAADSYTTWWLRHRAGLGLDRPFALPGGPGYLPPAPSVVAGLDPQAQRWLGGVGPGERPGPAGWVALLAGLDEGDPVPLALAVDLWRTLAGVGARPGPLADAPLLPALVGDLPGGAPDVRAVPTDDIAAASPMWAQLAAVRPAVVVPADVVDAVADGMDLDVAADRSAGAVGAAGRLEPTPDAVTAVFPAAPASWVEHEDLRVDGEPVDWWVDGQVHAGTTAGLARGLAEHLAARGRPGEAARIELLLTDPESAPRVLLDLAGEPEGPPAPAR